MDKVTQAIFSALPSIAKLVLWAQRQAGVTHSTWVGTAAEWILRGDRRVGVGQAPAGNELRRVTDQFPTDLPGGGA